MYAKSLLLNPANGFGLPTLNCCTVNCGSGRVVTCWATWLAAFHEWSAADICVLFASASAINWASGVGFMGISCADARMPVANTNAAVQYKATFMGQSP